MVAYRSPEETGERRRTARETLFAETEAESKGQAGAEVPVLRFIRPGLSARGAGGGKGAGASQPGRAWGGRREGIPGRHSGVAARQDLCAESGTARLHTEGKWETEAV